MTGGCIEMASSGATGKRRKPAHSLQSAFWRSQRIGKAVGSRFTIKRRGKFFKYALKQKQSKEGIPGF